MKAAWIEDMLSFIPPIAFLVADSGMGLVTAEHPPIGAFHLFGHTVWQGWFMIVVMLLSVPGTVILDG